MFSPQEERGEQEQGQKGWNPKEKVNATQRSDIYLHQPTHLVPFTKRDMNIHTQVPILSPGPVLGSLHCVLSSFSKEPRDLRCTAYPSAGLFHRNKQKG